MHVMHPPGLVDVENPKNGNIFYRKWVKTETILGDLTMREI